MGLRSFFHRLTAPPVIGQSPDGPCKMVCVVNHGLKMGKGKIAAQVGHGAVMATMKAGSLKPLFVEQWLATGQQTFFCPVASHCSTKSGLSDPAFIVAITAPWPT